MFGKKKEQAEAAVNDVQEAAAVGAGFFQRHRTGSVVAAAVVALLLVIYLILCGVVSRGVMVPRTTINGQDVSGMTKEEASQVVERIFVDDYSELKLPIAVGDKEYPVDLSGILDLDVAGSVQEAYDFGHGLFFLRGGQWIAANLAGNTRHVHPNFSDEKALDERIDKSGVLEVNTAVDDKYELKDKELVLTAGTSGETPNPEELRAAIVDTVEYGDCKEPVQAPTDTTAPMDLDMKEVYKEVYADPADATLDPKKDYKVKEAVQGIDFDPNQAQTVLNGLAEGESGSVPLKRTDPKISTEDLKEHLFKNKLGSYTTSVGGTSTRHSNVRKAAEYVNGTILLAGETFSYNDTVGERTTDRGFGSAPAYVNGETVNELGGGVCQVSSTLYSATVLANLEIVERANHTYESSYIPLGMDATVSWGGPDYKFKNNTDYPVKIEADYDGDDGSLTCQIWGTNLDGTSVKFTHDVLETYDYSTIYHSSDSMYEGNSYVSQVGETGYKVQSYREIYDKDDKQIDKKEEALSVYSKRDQIVVRGTKKKVVKKKSTKKNNKKNNKKKNNKKNNKKSSKKSSGKKTENKKKKAAG